MGLRMVLLCGGGSNPAHLPEDRSTAAGDIYRSRAGGACVACTAVTYVRAFCVLCTIGMDSTVHQYCNRYCRRFKVQVTSDESRCFKALHQVLLIYHEHEHSAASRNSHINLRTDFTSFRHSNSASLRALATSQMDLDIKNSSSECLGGASEECLDTLGSSTDILAELPGKTPRVTSVDLTRQGSRGTRRVTIEEPARETASDHSDMANAKRFMSLGANLHEISEENSPQQQQQNDDNDPKLSVNAKTRQFIDDLFKDWDKELTHAESSPDILSGTVSGVYRKHREDTIKHKYQRARTLDMGTVERDRYTVNAPPQCKTSQGSQSKNKWLFGFGWMSSKKSKNPDSDPPEIILKDSIKVFLRLKKALKKRKLEEDADLLQEMAIKLKLFRNSAANFGTSEFDLLTFQDNLVRLYHIVTRFARKHLSKSHRNLLTRLYAFYSRTYFLQTVFKQRKFLHASTSLCQSLAVAMAV